MQAAGLANDHVTTCFRYRELVTEPPARGVEGDAMFANPEGGQTQGQGEKS